MSYTQLLYHIVIRTKKNHTVLSLDHSEELYRYIWGIVKNKKSVLYRINGTEDHVHLLVSMHPTIALSDMVKDIKAASSKFLKQEGSFNNFTSWSEGYAALTYSLREKDTIINYIKGQRKHHQKVPFKDEYKAFIHEMGLEFDERDWDK